MFGKGGCWGYENHENVVQFVRLSVNRRIVDVVTFKGVYKLDIEKEKAIFDESYEALLELAKAESEGGIEAGILVIESFNDDVLTGVMAHLMTLITLENPPLRVKQSLQDMLRRLEIVRIERLQNRTSQQ